MFATALTDTCALCVHAHVCVRAYAGWRDFTCVTFETLILFCFFDFIDFDCVDFVDFVDFV